MEGNPTETPLVSIIDDDDSKGWAAAVLVGSAGLRVLVFQSVEDFILSGQLPHTACLVVDAHLPGMSGSQLQNHLAASGRYIPMVFTSAAADEVTRARARELGAMSVIDKPSGGKSLLDEVRLILKAQGLRKQEGGRSVPP
jgi:FixJ family two-component response regulator